MSVSWKSRCSLRPSIWGEGKSCSAFILNWLHKDQAFDISLDLKYKKTKEREVWVKYDHSIYFSFPKSHSPGPYKLRVRNYLNHKGLSSPRSVTMGNPSSYQTAVHSGVSKGAHQAKSRWPQKRSLLTDNWGPNCPQAQLSPSPQGRAEA